MKRRDVRHPGLCLPPGRLGAIPSFATQPQKRPKSLNFRSRNPKVSTTRRVPYWPCCAWPIRAYSFLHCPNVLLTCGVALRGPGAARAADKPAQQVGPIDYMQNPDARQGRDRTDRQIQQRVSLIPSLLVQAPMKLAVHQAFMRKLSADFDGILEVVVCTLVAIKNVETPSDDFILLDHKPPTEMLGNQP